MPNFIETDKTVTLAEQLEEGGGPVVLVATFDVPPEGAEQLIAAWAADAAIMKRQPGFISTQLHRGIAGSGAFVNYAVWESVALYRVAWSNPEFRSHGVEYPTSATASPHLFRPIAIPGICIA